MSGRADTFILGRFTCSSAHTVYLKTLENAGYELERLGMLLRSMTSLAPVSALPRQLGLYAAVALIVPGGSLIAFLLWAFRQRPWLAAYTPARHTHRTDSDDGHDALIRR
jgi:hypothetical protein